MSVPAIIEKASGMGMPASTPILLASGVRQEILLFRHGHGQKRWPISTARAGFGSRQDSHMTPTGFHKVTEIIGVGSPSGTIFRGRVPTGQVWLNGKIIGQCVEGQPASSPDGDLILSRILRLQGLEPGLNQGPGIDSYSRYIYIHGTNHEDQLGHATSGGCLRMSNADVIELCDVLGGDLPWLWIGADT